MNAEFRRHQRLTLRTPVRIIWTDRSGTSRFFIGNTLDFSDAGVKLELPDPIEVRALVGLQAERIGLACSGSVRTCVRKGLKYLVGIEFSTKPKLKPEYRAMLDAAAADQHAPTSAPPPATQP